MQIKPIILSGGSGTRLWPISRKTTPKQFVDIFNSGTNLFEQTLKRVQNNFFSTPIIISNKEQRFDVLKSIRNNNIDVDKMLLESSPKNTAAAFAISSHFCAEDDILCFFPSDHYIKNNTAFLKAIKKSCEIASQESLVILGIKSTNPNTNYGYITYKKNKKIKNSFQVKGFFEKPTLSRAKELIKKNALWNSGIVVVKNSYLKKIFNKFAKSLFIKTETCKNNSFKDIPILMLTAMGESQDRIQGLEAGVDDYMVKPFEPRELLLRINSILRRIPTDSTLTPTEALLGVLRFDLERLELFEGENIINLTSGEAKLLGILASDPGEVFSREELNNRLDLNSGERAIDVQINRLRQKIELDPKSPRYLHTVRGKGYVLRPD